MPFPTHLMQPLLHNSHPYTDSVALVFQIAAIPRNTPPAQDFLRRKSPLLPFPARRTSPLVLWHLLSLDAPSVATLWTWSIASTNGIHLPWTAIAAMATTVWLLYAADRLLDARLLQGVPADAAGLEARHHFHHQHRPAFRLGIAIASVTLAVLLPTLPSEAIRLYLIEASFLAGYFLLVHMTPRPHRLPKEFAVGLFFAAATFIPTVARQPALRLPLLPPALLFAALCTLNCLFIYAWEHPHPTFETTHITTRVALSHLHAIAVTILLAALALLFTDDQVPWPLSAAIALSAALLLVLHHSRHKMTPTALRAAADLALLTPVLFLLA